VSAGVGCGVAAGTWGANAAVSATEQCLARHQVLVALRSAPDHPHVRVPLASLCALIAAITCGDLTRRGGVYSELLAGLEGPGRARRGGRPRSLAARIVASGLVVRSGRPPLDRQPPSSAPS
jgi:hypothetical protein